MELAVYKTTVGSQNENCYLIVNGEVAWLIDPGDEYEKIIGELNLDKFKLKGIINTHGHFDHIGAVAQIKERYNVPFFLHSKDKRLVSQANLLRRITGDLIIQKTPVIDHYLDNLTYLELDDKKILIHYAPGHTFGGVCFEIDGNLFTGDLFFENSLGRVDLPGGNKEMLINSANLIFENFIGFRIYPGHGPSFILDENLIIKLNTK